MAATGWISENAFQDLAIPTVALQDSAITNPKIADQTIQAIKLAPGAGSAGYYGMGTYGNCFYG